MFKSHPIRRRSAARQGLRASQGQAMAEFALVTPLLVLLLFGLTYAAFYGFRAAAADWGVFITGVAEGVYDTPATDPARQTVPWADLRNSLVTEPLGLETRQVRSQIEISRSYPLTQWFGLTETHQGSAFFRLWRFYAGPPEGDFD